MRLYRPVPTIPCRLLVLGLLTLSTGCDQVRGLLGQDTPADAKAEAKAEPAAKEEPKADAGDAKATPDAKAASGAIEPDEKGEPDGKAEPPPPDAAAEVASAGAMPCVIGRWDAVDYSAAVEHAIAKDETLRSMKRTSSGGHVAYVLADPNDGKGVITATADALTYAFSGKVQGYAVTAKVTIDGETVADYELVGDDGIRIAKPTKNTMKAKVAASVKGIASAKQNKTIDLDFDGSFVFDCTEEKLEVWRGARSKARPTSFRRAPAETP